MDRNQFDFSKEIAACLKNGERLLADADWLNYEEHRTSSFFLANIAQEEFAKAFLLFLVATEVIPWNPLIYRATKDHTCKQLLILIMKYVNPYSGEADQKIRGWMADHKERMSLWDSYKSCSDPAEQKRMLARIHEINAKHDQIPKSITDAICIFRHEKIDRWRSSDWVWEEDPIYDETVKSIWTGKVDREKQDALYVRLGKDGHLANSPALTVDADAAIQAAQDLQSLAKDFLAGDVPGTKYDRVESMLRTAFETLQTATAESA